MIYCNLKGGLGNMIFQIAATKSLSIDRDTDCSFPNLETHLKYLQNESTYNPYLKHTNEYKYFFRNLNTIPLVNKLSIISYPFEYVKIDIKEIDFMIDGFFQSEKYFMHNRKEILDFLSPSESLINYVQSKYNNILKYNLTSIHVRRGDYIKYPNHHPIQTIDYYKKSIGLLKKLTDIFVVFSDDIEWCKNNFIGDNFYFVENEKDYLELILMSYCHNNIISNSSFSWWGGWMNQNPQKIVIGPEKWFGNKIKHKTSDILPENWIKY